MQCTQYLVLNNPHEGACTKLVNSVSSRYILRGESVAQVVSHWTNNDDKMHVKKCHVDLYFKSFTNK